jgi:prolipoprotein diacylglyceryl transferase
MTLQSFGLMLALGFLAGTFLFVRKFRGEQERENAYNLAIIAIVAGVLGSRVLFWLENPSAISGVLDFFSFWKGGLSWFGGFFGALLGVVAYIKLKGLGFWAIADKAAPSVAIGQVLGRMGCILGDGGHVGKLTTMPWGFDVNGEVRHVTAWYEMLGAAAVFVILTRLGKGKHRPGFIFGAYLVGYGLVRFVSDFFRIDPAYFGLTIAQYICIVMAIAGSALIAKNWANRK